VRSSKGGFPPPSLANPRVGPTTLPTKNSPVRSVNRVIRNRFFPRRTRRCVVRDLLASCCGFARHLWHVSDANRTHLFQNHLFSQQKTVSLTPLHSIAVLFAQSKGFCNDCLRKLQQELQEHCSYDRILLARGSIRFRSRHSRSSPAPAHLASCSAHIVDANNLSSSPHVSKLCVQFQVLVPISSSAPVKYKT
jgi:hypothetical protein